MGYCDNFDCRPPGPLIRWIDGATMDCFLRHFFRDQAMEATEALLLAVANKIAEIPTPQLIWASGGLEIHAPDECQMGILQGLVELAEGFQGARRSYAKADVQALALVAGYITYRLKLVDTSFITCWVCHERLARTQRLLAEFQQYLEILARPRLFVFAEAARLRLGNAIRWADGSPYLSVHEPTPAEFCQSSPVSAECRHFLENGVLRRWWSFEYDVLAIDLPAPTRRELCAEGWERLGFIPRADPLAHQPHLRGEPRIRGPDRPQRPVQNLATNDDPRDRRAVVYGRAPNYGPFQLGIAAAHPSSFYTLPTTPNNTKES